MVTQSQSQSQAVRGSRPVCAMAERHECTGPSPHRPTRILNHLHNSIPETILIWLNANGLNASCLFSKTTLQPPGRRRTAKTCLERCYFIVFYSLLSRKIFDDD